MGVVVLWIASAFSLVGQRLAAQEAILNLDGAALEVALRAPELSPAERALYRHHWAFVRTLTQGSAERLAEYETQTANDISLLEAQPPPQGWAFRAQAYAERALIHLMAGEQLAAFWDLHRAHNLTRQLATEYPSAGLHLRLEGLFALGVSSLPSTYQWFARQLGYEGDETRGRILLRQAEKDPYFGMEVSLYNYFISKHVDGDSGKALEYLNRQRELHPLSPLIAYLYGSHLLELRRVPQALEQLEAVVRSRPQLFFPFYWHLLGRGYLFREQYDRAQVCFDRFLAQQSGALLRRDAQFRRAMCRWLSDKTRPETVFAAVWDEPDSGFDDDQAAVLQALALTRGEYSHTDRQLYRARYAYDGGQYARAIHYLEGVESQPILTEDQKLELAYRHARIAQAEGRINDARLRYLQALARSPQYQGWMLPYSLYYLGQLSENQQKMADAFEYYSQALAYSGFAYAQGLEQKAKAGRSRMRRQLRSGAE